MKGMSEVQGDNSGQLQPIDDLVTTMTVLAPIWPLLQLPTAQAG